jgi:ribulose-5-phosphate 4-epimerase/fuculose-1-phosphate aldolase
MIHHIHDWLSVAASLSRTSKYIFSLFLYRPHLNIQYETKQTKNHRNSNLIYMAPSGVQKERIKPEDLFILNPTDRSVIRSPPPSKGWKMTQCAPLFFNAYTLRDAGSCIHTHSQHAVMATLLYPGEVFKITHQEMIKGIRIGSTKQNLKFYDLLEVPIIENTAEEEDLQERMAQVRLKERGGGNVLGVCLRVSVFWFSYFTFRCFRRWSSTPMPMPFSLGTYRYQSASLHSVYKSNALFSLLFSF